MRSGPRPPGCWAVCVRCLKGDVDQGRAAHIRRAWTHPLAVFCFQHGVPLLPHGHSPIKIAGDLTLFGDREVGAEPRDTMLETADFDSGTMIQRIWRALETDTGQRRLEHRLRFRWAVRDVVDALAANRRDPRNGALASLFEQPLFGRKSLQGSNRLQMDWLSDLPLNFHPVATRVSRLVTPSGAVEATGRRAELSDGAAGRPVAIRCAA